MVIKVAICLLTQDRLISRVNLTSRYNANAQKLRHTITKVGGWKRQDGGAMLGESHPGKGKQHTKRWTEEMRLAHSIRCKKREEQKRQLAKEN
jgi:hypothetical protein